MRRVYTMFITVLITVSVLAQENEKMSYQTVSRIKPESIEDQDTAYSLDYPSRLYSMVGYVPLLKDMTGELNFPIIETRENINGLTMKPVFLKSNWTSLSWNATTISGYRYNDTYRGNWRYLTLSPAFVTGKNYYDLTVKSPWLLNTNPWVNDTFWTALLRNSYLYFNNRK